jgi:hypothetical protein
VGPPFPLGETRLEISCFNAFFTARGKDDMLKRILVTAFLGGALVFTAPAAMANPHGRDRDRHERHENGRGWDRGDHRRYDRDDHRSYRHDYDRSYHHNRYDYDDDYYYYGYSRPYSGRCYYRGGYRYYYDGGYSNRYCDDYYYRHGYRSGYPNGYDTCDEYDYRTGYC